MSIDFFFNPVKIAIMCPKDLEQTAPQVNEQVNEQTAPQVSQAEPSQQESVTESDPAPATNPAPATTNPSSEASDSGLQDGHSAEFGIDETGDLEFNYNFSSSVKPIKEITVDFSTGLFAGSVKIKELIDHIIEATPTKKDDNIYKEVSVFLPSLLSFLSFSKSLQDKCNIKIAINSSGVFHFSFNTPPELPELKALTIRLKDGKLESNVDLVAMIDSIIESTPTKKDNKILAHIRGLIVEGLKLVSFKKKITV